MIGRVWPFHVVKVDAGTGRVRVFLITSPEMRGNISAAIIMQALLPSARLLAVARTLSEAAMAILMCIRPPDASRKASTHLLVSRMATATIRTASRISKDVYRLADRGCREPA